MNVKMDRWRRALRYATAVASVGVAACGGGEQVEAFAPNRMIAFGDESSVIDDAASPGTDVSTPSTAPCRRPTRRSTASSTRFGSRVPRRRTAWSFLNATPDGPGCRSDQPDPGCGRAKVADLSAQIDAQQAEGSFNAKDLVSVLIGQNDVLAQYAQYPAVSDVQLVANVEAAGRALGDQVNRIANAGAKVLISTIPDLGLTPFAIVERATHTDADRAALLSHLSARFNATMRATIVNDGRRIGLVLLDEYIQSVVAVVNGGGFTNVVNVVCDTTKAPTLPECTSLTLVSGGSASTWLWADTTHLSSGGQQALGSLASQRAANNPF
jgi:hypothetical protein